jgi:hypothetical protein
MISTTSAISESQPLDHGVGDVGCEVPLHLVIDLPGSDSDRVQDKRDVGLVCGQEAPGWKADHCHQGSGLYLLPADDSPTICSATSWSAPRAQLM